MFLILDAINASIISYLLELFIFSYKYIYMYIIYILDYVKIVKLIVSRKYIEYQHVHMYIYVCCSM